jgi:hypothetical protein
MRRSVRTAKIVRHASLKFGGRSSSSAVASSAPMARRSWAPRTGSRSRSDRTIRTIVGMAKKMNGARHENPSTPTISVLPIRGAKNWPTLFADRWAEYTFTRTSGS